MLAVSACCRRSTRTATLFLCGSSAMRSIPSCSEMPAGKMDYGPEDAEECGIRELKEETGCTAGRIVPLGAIYPSPGFLTEVTPSVCRALDLTEGEMQPDEGRICRGRATADRRGREMIERDEIRDAKRWRLCIEQSWKIFTKIRVEIGECRGGKGLDKKKSFVVEDEKAISDILVFNLQREGYDTPLAAYDGAEGQAARLRKRLT